MMFHAHLRDWMSRSVTLMILSALKGDEETLASFRPYGVDAAD